MKNINRIVDNAHWYNLILNSEANLNPSIGITNLNDHLNDCIKNPIIGKIARHQDLLKKPMTDNYTNNYSIISKEKSFYTLEHILNERINKLYPKTKFLRNILIDNDRINLSTTKPKLVSSVKKGKIKLNLFIQNFKKLLK